MKPTTRDSVFSALDNQPYRRVFLENGNWMGTLCLCALISSHCTADCIFTHSFHLFFPIAVETKSFERNNKFRVTVLSCNAAYVSQNISFNLGICFE